MSDVRKTAPKDIIAGWTDDEIDQLELSFLHRMFDCKDGEGVDTTVSYARFMSKVKLDPDNYPIFLKLIQFENHWVVDALVSGADPVKFLTPVQPNGFIISECFKMFTKWKPGGIYATNLLILFGVLRVAYENPHDGYKLYRLSVSDVNNLGKHLDKSQDQNYPVNRTILEILDKIAALNDPGGLSAQDKNALEASTQANNIRGKFLDSTKKMNEAIPDNLLRPGDYKKSEVAPSHVK